MSRASGISKFISKLLPPGEYAKAAQKAVVETDAERLARLAKTHPSIDKKTAAFDREKLRNLFETRMKDNPTPENKKILEDFYEQFYGIKPNNTTIETPRSKIIPGKRKPLQQKELDAFQETLETRVRENPTPENIEVLDNFRKKREAKEYPDLSQALKVAGLAGAIGAGVSLMPEEAEAAFPGSVLARKNVLKQSEKAMDAWTSGKKAAGGGRELREVLQGQLDLDPTGAARKEALRRLAARTEVRQNPVTGEHEFKVYRGDAKDRAGETAQSFTTNPDVAQEFADAYGGQVRETWLPASKVGSIPSIMKEGQYLSSEGEVIAKPFKAESSLYIPKEPSLHQRISARGVSKEAPEETDDFISEMLSEAPSTKKVDDLPMDFKSRMARAKEMGFDINNPLYHGTRFNFDKFKPSESGTFGKAVYVTESQDSAHRWANPREQFIENQNIIPLYSNAKIFDLENPEHQKILKNRFGESWKDYTAEEFAGAAKDAGFDAIRYGGTVAIFDPKHLRSKFAEFDPSKRNSSNISAGIGAALGIGALSGKDSEAAQVPVDGSIVQANPEFAGKQALADEASRTWRAPSWLRSPSEVGEAALERGGKALESLDKYSGRPARAALLAALEKRNPLTAAKEAITEDKDTEGKEVSRALLKAFEEGGMPLRAPGQENYPLENILGTGVDFVADPTNLIGSGAATKAGKFFKTLK